MNLGSGGAAGFGGFGSTFGSKPSAAFGSTAPFGTSSSTAGPAFGVTSTTFGIGRPAATAPAFGSSAASTPATAFGASVGFGSSSSAAFGAPSSVGTTTTGFGTAAAPTATSFGSAAPPSTAFGTSAAPSISSTGFGGLATFGQTTFGSAATAPSATFGTTTAPTTGFGTTTAPTTGFGGVSTTTPFGSSSTTSTFGGSAAPPTTSFGSTSSAPFGSAAAPATTSTFGSTTTFGGSTATAFGSTTSTPFGSTAPAFGSTTTTFGSAAPTTTFGSAAPTTTFGSAAPTTTFGSAAPTTTFGSNTSAFGTTAAPTAFGSSTTLATTFGRTSPAPTTTTSFGSSSTATFGKAATSFGRTSPAPTTTPFGSTNSSTTFGQAAPTATTPATTFGNSAPTTFGSSKPASFGSTSTSTTFGSSKPASFGSTSTSATFGSSTFQDPTASSSITTVFGRSSGSQQPPASFGSTCSPAASFGKPPPSSSTLNPPPLPSSLKPFNPPTHKRVPPPPRPTSLKAAAPLPSPDGSPTHDTSRRRRIPPTSMDDQPDNDVEKLDLSSAVTIDGLCVDMCSPKERDEQIRCDDLSTFEKGNPPEAFIIKRYQRSAADHKLDIPSEIRPLGVLRMTQLYLEQHVIDLDECGPDPRFNPPRVPDFLDLYNFFWNRARMIRNDFTLQNYRGGGRHHVIAMDVHERIARFFILCEHELIENPKFIEQQNMEQLGKTMKSLQDFYDDARLHGAESSPFEAEFAGYFILLHLDKASAVLKFTKRLPRSLLHSTFVQFAMAAFVARHTNDYVAFFRLVRQASLLQACLLHRYFPLARSDALGCMARVYRHPYPLEPLVRLLCFDSLQHAATVVGLHGLALSADGASVVFGTADFVADKVPVTCSDVYVRSKQGDWRRRDVCRGVTEYDPDKYPLLPRQIQETEMDERRRLYPTRPLYNDPFSKFTLENAQPNSDIHQLRRVGTSSASLEAPPPPVLAEPLSSAPPPPPPRPLTTVFGSKKPPVVDEMGVIPGLSKLTEIEQRQKRLQQDKQRLLDEIAKRQHKSTHVAASSTIGSVTTTSSSTSTRTATTMPSAVPRNEPIPASTTPVVQEDATSSNATHNKVEPAKALPHGTISTKSSDQVDDAAAIAKQKEADAAAIAAATRKAQEAAAAKEAKEAAAKEAAAKAAKEAADKEAAAEKKRVELERKEAAKRESERREALKAKYEIQALGQTWLRINFDSHDAVVARSNAMLKQEHDEVARAQRLAVQKLRFALWRKMVSRQQRPRVPGNAKFEPSTCGPHATASSVVQFQGPIESLLSNYYPKATPPTAWTSTDKAITDASHAAMLALQHQLHKPVDVAGLLAPRLKRRYPRASSLAYSIAICRLPTDEDEDDKVSSSTSSTSTFDAAAWLAAKCGVSSGGHRVYTHESFALHLSSSVAPRSGPNTAVWFPVAFACLDQVGPWVRRLVNSSVLRGAPTAVHVVALTALHPHEVEATGQIELDRLASNWHLHWHVGPWDAAHAVVTSLAKSMGDTVTLIPVVPFTNVPLRDTIDDVVALTLHQTSLLSRPHISDLVRHVHHALSVLQRLFDASDSSSSDLMGQVLAAVPPSGTSGSTHGWIHSLPTLSATQRELAVHLVEAAWQLPHDQDEDASPAKSIVSIVYAIVLNGIEGLDAAVVALPTSWVVECRQLMHLVRTVSSIDKHARVLGKKRPPEDENVSTGALVAMMKKRSTTLTTAMTITPTTRHALQAKWKRDAARMRAMRALDHEKAAHAAFRRMLESAFET